VPPMKPILTDDTLQHNVIHRVFGVWIRSAASAVNSVEVVIVAVVVIARLLVRTKLARHHVRELAVAAVTAEVSLGVQLRELMSIMARQAAREAHTGSSTVYRAALDTSIQRLTWHVALTHRQTHNVTSPHTSYNTQSHATSTDSNTGTSGLLLHHKSVNLLPEPTSPTVLFAAPFLRSASH